MNTRLKTQVLRPVVAGPALYGFYFYLPELFQHVAQWPLAGGGVGHHYQFSLSASNLCQQQYMAKYIGQGVLQH